VVGAALLAQGGTFAGQPAEVSSAVEPEPLAQALLAARRDQVIALVQAQQGFE
jgi:hypothetical protein